jgi:hypothetical protein
MPGLASTLIEFIPVLLAMAVITSMARFAHWLVRYKPCPVDAANRGHSYIQLRYKSQK